ncbi:hypothetical protein AMECASPLE_034508 [Ameca splendens]|uniref:Uncharacterized protein n=1 Tax=Ameca splendens TaxID=208324 RepID=A0ABV0XWC7_9TELE
MWKGVSTFARHCTYYTYFRYTHRPSPPSVPCRSRHTVVWLYVLGRFCKPRWSSCCHVDKCHHSRLAGKPGSLTGVRLQEAAELEVMSPGENERGRYISGLIIA